MVQRVEGKTEGFLVDTHSGFRLVGIIPPRVDRKQSRIYAKRSPSKYARRH